MEWTIILTIVLSAIGVVALVKIVQFLWTMGQALYLAILIKQTQNKQPEFESEEQRLIRKGYEDYIEKRDKQIAIMELKGYKKLDDKGSMWMERENGKIKALYNRDGLRIPLACLSQLSGTKVVGNEPVLYFYGEKIDKWRMWKDEDEIRKLNAIGQ